MSPDCQGACPAATGAAPTVPSQFRASGPAATLATPLCSSLMTELGLWPVPSWLPRPGLRRRQVREEEGVPHCALESCVHPEGQREPLSPRGSKEGDTQSRVQGDCPSRWSPVSLALGRGRQLREGRCLCPSPPGLDLELWVTVSGAGVGWGGAHLPPPAVPGSQFLPSNPAGAGPHPEKSA